MVDTPNRPEFDDDSREVELAFAVPERDVANARSQILVSPPSGDQDALPIEAKLGADLIVAFDPASADVSLVGQDLVFTFADGSQTILTNFAAAAADTNVALPDGRVLTGGVIVAELTVVEDALNFETAAGPLSSSGGGSVYSDDMGSVIDMLNANGTIPLTAFAQHLAEAEEPVSVLQAVNPPVAAAAQPAATAAAQPAATVNEPAAEDPAPILPTLSIDDVTVTEGDPSLNGEQAGVNATITFTVSRAGDLSSASTVDYAVIAGGARAPGDYNNSLAGLSGTVTFAAGEGTKTVTFDVTDDLMHELTETFTVELSAPTGATIDDGLGVGTILDNDPAPSVSIDNITIHEGGVGGSATASFTISLSAATYQDVTVTWSLADVTTLPADYSGPTSGTATIAAGTTSVVVSPALTFTAVDDDIHELAETFTVTLDTVSGGGATGAGSVGTGTVVSDDPAPSVSIDNITIYEGGVGGSATASFTISLSAATYQDVTVTWSLADVTTLPADYSGPTSGTATIAAGTTSVVVSPALTFTAVDDDIHELAETFTVTLDTVSGGGATGAGSVGTGTVVSDDPAPSVSIDNITIYEGGVGGSATASFTISLSAATYQDVTVTWSLADVTTLPADYSGPTSGTATIAAGTTSVVVSPALTFTAVDDDIHELAETFTVTLDTVSGGGATGAGSVGTGTVVSDDPAPSVSIDNITIYEGGVGGSATASFTISLSAATYQDVTVTWSLADVTTLPADYSGPTSGTATIAAGTTSVVVSPALTFTAADDDIHELAETFTVTLDTVSGGGATGAGSVGTGTVISDDPAPGGTISVVDMQVYEDGEATSTGQVQPSVAGPLSVALSFTIALDDAAGSTVTKITLSGLPADATITTSGWTNMGGGVWMSATAAPSGGNVVVDVELAQHTDIDLSISVSAEVTSTLNGDVVAIAAAETLDVTVDAVADMPTALVAGATINGFAYSVGGNKDTQDATLYRINLDDGTVTAIGTVQAPGETAVYDINALSYDPDTGLLYGFLDTGNASVRGMVTIDPSNASTTRVTSFDGIISESMGSTFGDGTMYVVAKVGNTSVLYTVNTDPASADYGKTTVLDFADPSMTSLGHVFEGLAYDEASDTLYAVGTDGNETWLYVIDLDAATGDITGVTALVFISDSADIEGIAMGGNGKLWAIDRVDGQIYEIDPVLGSVTPAVTIDASTVTAEGLENLSVISSAARTVMAGDTFDISFQGKFSDFVDGSEIHTFFIRLPNAQWATGGMVVTLGAGNAYGLSAGDYLMVDADPLIDPATGIAKGSVSLQAPDDGTTGYFSYDLKVYSVAQEINEVDSGGFESAANNVAVAEVTVDLTVLSGDLVLLGPAADNTLDGGAGDDLLVGGSGDDVLSGGGGSDVFVFRAGETGADTITDFDVASDANPDNDILDVSDLLTVDPSNYAISELITITETGAGAVVSVDADGAGGASVIATLQGVSAGDMVSVLLDANDGAIAVTVA